MSSKDEKENPKRNLLGRPKNDVGMGIVGLPNVGKSTLFNALSSLNVPAENFPFCTIEPNTAKVPVPDDRFDVLCEICKPAKEVPAVLTITDIAGLVKGANEGQGLGNEFLSKIQQVDAIYHVCRAFKDSEIQHVEGSVDPVRDIEIIANELRLKDKSWVSNKLLVVQKDHQRNKLDKEAKQKFETLTIADKLLNEGKDIRNYEWQSADIEVINEMNLLSAKPVVYLVNIGYGEYIEMKNKWVMKIKEWVAKNDSGAKVIPFSAAFEFEFSRQEDKEKKKKYCEEKKAQSIMSRIIQVGYSTLDLIQYFTSGSDEVRAWTIKRGTLAPKAAGVIHGDFEKNFIAAECMAFVDFKEYGTELAVKAAGKYKTQGKLYEVKDGDILFIKHNAGGAAKKK